MTVDPPAAGIRRFKMRYVLGAVAAACLIVLAVMEWRSEGRDLTTLHPPAPAPTAPESASAGSRVKVDVVKPQTHGLGRKTTQPGTAHAFEYADLYAKTSGYLGQQSVDIGDRFKHGQLLAKIDVPELQAAVNEAKATLTRAQSVVKQTEARLVTQRAEAKAARALVKQAEADVAKAHAQVVYRKSQYARIKDLVASRSVEQKLEDEQQDALDSAQATLLSAHAAVDNAAAQADAADARVQQAEADIVHAQADVQVSEAMLEKAKVFLNYTRITSPYDGVVTFRGFHRGDYINSRDQGAIKPLLTVARTDIMRVVIMVPDLDVPYVSVGDKASIDIDALNGKTFHGTVSRMADAEDPEQKVMRVEVDLPNPQNELREGMYGLATIELEHPSDALTIPSSALAGKKSGDQGKVYVVRDGHAKLVPIKIGQDDGLRMEVLAGLAATDEVIVGHQGALAEGAAVIVAQDDSEPATGH